jgi:predicted acetyltransferase
LAHFFFEVGPEHHGQSFGKKMRALALHEARRMSVCEMIVCADAGNPASGRAIESD